MVPCTLLFALLPLQADTTLVSLGLNGYAAGGASNQLSVSAEASWVAFSSLAGNLSGNDTNTLRGVFVLDRRPGSIFQASISSIGVLANLLPGTVVHCQYWYREAIPGTGPADRFSDTGYFELAP